MGTLTQVTENDWKWATIPHRLKLEFVQSFEHVEYYKYEIYPV